MLHAVPIRCSGKVMVVSVHPGADPGFGQGGTPASEAEICQCSRAEL